MGVWTATSSQRLTLSFTTPKFKLAVGRRQTLQETKGAEWSVHYTYVPNNGERILKGLRVGNRSW